MGFVISIRKGRAKKALYTLNMPGYNLFYFYLPLRQVLVILLFLPITVLSPVFTEKCGDDAGLSSFAGSVSILISIVIMVTLIASMHIG